MAKRNTEEAIAKNNAWMRERARSNRVFIQQYLRTHPCVRCGYSDIRALQFHHERPEEKVFHIGNPGPRSISAIEREIKKTIVLCACCHQIEHYEDRRNANHFKNKRYE